MKKLWLFTTEDAHIEFNNKALFTKLDKFFKIEELYNVSWTQIKKLKLDEVIQNKRDLKFTIKRIN